MPNNNQVSVLNDEQIAGIEARADAASPAPWYVVEGDHPDDWGVSEVTGAQSIAQMVWDIDAPFIARAREDVPALCATVKQLRTTRDDRLAEARRAEELAVRKWRDTEDERDRLQSQLEQLRAENKREKKDHQLTIDTFRQQEKIWQQKHDEFKTEAVELCKQRAAHYEALADRAQNEPSKIRALAYANAISEIGQLLEKLT